jgi:beta-lactamase superfamily II metal-dependent hydrolase
VAYEVDFLAVGPGASSGDAIAFRFANPSSGGRYQQFVVVIDGGYQADGERLVNLIHTFYGTTHVDLVISTHPDRDHAAGLAVVLENCTVGTLWMHLPWAHAPAITSAFSHSSVTVGSVRSRYRENLEAVRDLQRIAARKRIPMVEPFAGVTAFNRLLVVGPTVDYYRSLLTDFRDTPDTTATFSSLVEALYGIPRQPNSLAALSPGYLEALGVESLDESGTTEAENNSSVILSAKLDEGQFWLFTGDAGWPALKRAIATLELWKFDPNGYGFVHVPHHGSRSNLCPAVLDRLIGPMWPRSPPRKVALISAAALDPKHPSGRVVNALVRRGAEVYATKGTNLLYRYDAPLRPGYGPVTALLHSPVSE